MRLIRLRSKHLLSLGATLYDPMILSMALNIVWYPYSSNFSLMTLFRKVDAMVLIQAELIYWYLQGCCSV